MKIDKKLLTLAIKILVAMIIYGVIIIIVLGCQSTCYDHYVYDPCDNVVVKTRVHRWSFLMFGEADYVDTTVTPFGEWKLTAYDVIVDPEDLNVVTPYGTLGTGDDE